jgi:hypothetical protein
MGTGHLGFAGLALVLGAALTAVRAGPPGPLGPSGPSGPQEPRPPERAAIADLAWLAGSWTGDMAGQVAEETWSAPSAGAMMGMFRLLGETGTSVFEFLLLEESQANLYLRFQHFGPGYRPWEKSGPLEFRLTAASADAFTFESLDPNQSPTRIVYARPSPTQMIATVETVRGGRVSDSFDVVYTRRP